MENLQSIEESIAITNDCLNCENFPFENLSDRLKILTKVGIIISSHITLVADENLEQFSEKLTELEKNVEKISNKTREKFVYLKGFNIEYPVYAEIARTTFTLNKFMRDTMKHTNPQSIDVFRSACERSSPLSYAYNLISILDQDFTTDMIKEMNLEDFEEWRSVVNGIFFHLLFIETYSNGLLLKTNMYGPNVLKEEVKNLFERVDGSRANNEAGYWPKSVEELIHTIRNENIHLNNYEKADLLRDTLAKMFKNDSFYIIVFDDCTFGEEFAYDGNKNQTICSLQPGWCSFVVYRSRDWRSANQKDRDQIKNEVEACRSDVIPWWKSYTGFPTILQKERIHNTGFVGLFRFDKNVAVRSINSDAGPGNWIHATNKKEGAKFVLLAGFK